MYLKKIEMRGFKTFADRTELEFGPGITAIVGPNGTGKSNITDGLLWALGEQSNRALRTESSQDIIFAGSEARKPLGMGEVAVTIDNSDHRLPLDFSEVVVSRRLFRTGESEYLINRSIARLKDVRELLLDTGIGTQAYSVIGQGEIGAILSIRSEDRRELLEEVAGIRKYRVRRDEATRKLEAAEANMRRVDDIVAELMNQRLPLEKEADRAREYNTYADRLRELELRLLADDYQKRRLRLGKLLNEVEVTKADLQATRNRITEVEAEYEKVQFELARTADEVDRLRDAASIAERELDQARQAQALADERIRAAVERQQDLALRLEGQQRRAEELQTQLATVTAEHESVRGDHEQAEADRSAAEAELQEKARELAAKTERIRGLEAAQREALERAAALENEALALQGLEADLSERAQRLGGQAETLARRELQLQDAHQVAQERRTQLTVELTRARQELQRLREDLTLASKTLREQRQKCAVFSGAITAREAEAKLLTELERSHEGISDGAKAAVEAAAQDQLAGVHGVVAELLDVPARFERAVEAALGEALNWVVVETEDHASAGARYVLDNGSGRATFMPLASLTNTTAPATPAAPATPGALGFAAKVVRHAKEHERLIARLLGDTLIMRDLSAALALRHQLRTRLKLVTLDGEMVGPDGEVTAGGEEGPGTRAFQRRRELEELNAELDILRSHMAEMWKREESLDRWCEQLAAQIQERESQVSEFQSEQATTESEVTHLADQQRAARQMSQELSEEAGTLEERLEQAQERRTLAETDGQALRTKGEELGQEIESARRTGVAPAEVDALRAHHVSAQVRAAELAEKARSVEQLIKRYGAELERARAEHATAAQELAAARDAEAVLRGESILPGDDIATLEAHALAARERVNVGAAGLSELREHAAQLDNMRLRLDQSAREQSDRIHRTELGYTREEAQLDAIAERLQDIYGISPDEAVAQLVEAPVEREIRQEANELRESIRKLGPVNTSAIDECERLRSREDFLSGQLDDLRQARDDLLQVIAEIDEAATHEFVDAFERTRVEFQIMFERLFGGGTTELKLSDPERPLESGVDVIVQAPGKRQQNLLLLSGGERALTAAALLFAMLRVRPTPFCILDEIDAALDEANVGRFSDVLRDFAAGSQFIVITHNPHTIKQADVLFGVTMEQPGVSKIIKLELREYEDFLEHAEGQVGQLRPPRAASRILPTQLD